MYSINNLPESLAKINQIYTMAWESDKDIALEEFDNTFICPFYEISEYKKNIDNLIVEYSLNDIDSKLYWDVINTIDVINEFYDEEYDTKFDEFLLYLSYLYVLKNDQHHIALNKVITICLSESNWDLTIFYELLKYAVNDIYSQDDMLVEIMSQYKNHRNLLPLLFTVLDHTNLLAPHMKAKIFDNLVSEYVDPDPTRFMACNLLWELLHNPILGQWFHLLNVKSQSIIREYLDENPIDRYFASYTENKEKLQQYAIENNLNVNLGRPNNILNQARITPLQTQKRVENKIGRNDMCPCGSGKKYKKCCLK